MAEKRRVQRRILVRAAGERLDMEKPTKTKQNK